MKVVHENIVSAPASHKRKWQPILNSLVPGSTSTPCCPRRPSWASSPAARAPGAGRPLRDRRRSPPTEVAAETNGA
eukprot:scaffold260761_cov28-Tisochrysis_lutea.AAC.1